MTAVTRRGRRLRPDRRTVLYLYTAIEIVVGSLVLAWAILGLPVTPEISLTGSEGPIALVGGLAFWSGFTLLGGTRVGSIHGYGVLTFHMPFVLAAAALGGPAAGGIVAFIGTIELRELRDPPWYGLLANHAALALAGVASGLAMAAVAAWLAPLGLAGEAASLLAFVAGAVTFVLISVSLAAGTSMIRDERRAIDAYVGSFRATMLTEVAVGLLLTLLYGRIGPWSAVVGGVVVLQLIRLLGEREFINWVPGVPGLLKYEVFREKTDSLANLLPIGYLIITVEGWTTLVEACGREAAESLAGQVGAAIVGGLFKQDAAARSGPDEWRVVLARARFDGTRIAARKYWQAVTSVVADRICPGQPSLTVRIGGGVADDADHGGTMAVARAEQAHFRAAHAIVVRSEGSYTWDPSR